MKAGGLYFCIDGGKMLSIKAVKSALEDLKRILRADFYLCDDSFDTLVDTFDNFNLDKNIIRDFSSSSAESQNVKNFFLNKIVVDDINTLVLVVYSVGNDGYMISRVAASEIKHLLGAGSTAIDKNDFYLDLLLDNIIPAEIEKRASKFKIREAVKRYVFCISMEEEYVDTAVELLSNIFAENKNDLVLKIDDGKLIVIKIKEDDLDREDQYETANLIVSSINTELMIKAKVTYGRIAENLRELSESYKEAVMALEVAEIFYKERDVASYTSLGIGRLIHQLPESLCRLFLDEVLADRFERLSKEDMQIIELFFDNDLNVAETARAASMNRTTLIYRLDRMVKITGLDIRCFEDAMTLKIAMMVSRYVDYLAER